MNLDDTIVAIATPPGRGGIGIVRLSGPEAVTVASSLLRLPRPLQAGHAILAELMAPSRPASHTNQEAQKIDEVVVTFFQKPHSYTADDVVEISAHGSPVVLKHIVETAVARGARVAEPGEFTMRAFLNGRIDLTQAEAVSDLIEAQTLFQARVAAQQLEGALSRRLQPLKQQLIELIATLEAGVDFAEDDVSVLPAQQVLKRISAIQGPLQELADSFAYGKIVQEGLTLAIIGRPNVGKSSLFNRLVERERAIVTSAPGTTRDLVSETVAIGGIPVCLVDTAGLRATSDEAESIGVRKSYEALANADLVLLVVECSANGHAQAAVKQRQEEEQLLAHIGPRPRIIVHNKSDLQLSGTRAPRSTAELRRVITSAVTGAGIAELRSEILRTFGGEAGPQQETGMLTNARHQGLVRESLSALESASLAAETSIPHEMILLDLYSALRPLDAITGATTTDDILNLIFSRFCIGK